MLNEFDKAALDRSEIQALVKELKKCNDERDVAEKRFKELEKEFVEHRKKELTSPQVWCHCLVGHTNATSTTITLAFLSVHDGNVVQQMLQSRVSQLEAENLEFQRKLESANLAKSKYKAQW